MNPGLNCSMSSLIRVNAGPMLLQYRLPKYINRRQKSSSIRSGGGGSGEQQ